MLRLRLEQGGSGTTWVGIRVAKSFAKRAHIILQKTMVSWYSEFADFEVPNQIQPEEHSTGGGIG